VVTELAGAALVALELATGVELVTGVELATVSFRALASLTDGTPKS